jgi:predicted membrane protein
MYSRHRSNPSAHLWFGGILILLGTLFLLDTLGIANTHEVIARGWPLILIAIGGSRLLNADTTESRIGGGIWLFLGFAFLLSTLGYLHFNVWRLIWPVVLITVGVLMVLRSRFGGRPPLETQSTIGPMAFMGGVDRRVNSKTFEGGELTAVMGGCKIDLREADIQGTEAVVRVFVMMGGIELFIPQGWKVINRVVPVMGGFVDRTNPSAPGPKQLVIDGFLMMGGIEVKNY